MINAQQIFRIFKNHRFLKQGTNHILIQHNDKYQFCICICQDDDYPTLNEKPHLRKRKNCFVNNASSAYFYIYLPESLIINKLRQINLNYLLND